MEFEPRRRLLFQPEEQKPFPVPLKWALTLTVIVLVAAGVFFALTRSTVVRSEEGRPWIGAETDPRGRDVARTDVDPFQAAVVDPEVQ